ncbi:hypothetical protein [Halosimplex amylolyticum]|uniref:hypothetical protein n=1 Tax=Halosimplex amylolyticum TaxID=3396616 RepID=UPI003F56AC8A
MRRSRPSIRRPDHTGADRCWPCTAVNLGLLALGCLALAAVSPAASAVLAVGGVGVIWLRGYLVPYTPRFAPRLVARLPWDPFPAGHGRPPSRRAGPADSSGGGRAASGSGRAVSGSGQQSVGDDRDADRETDADADRTPATLADATTADGEAVLADLVAAGVADAAGDDVRLAEGFEERWQSAIRSLRERSPEGLAAATLAAAPAADAAEAVTDRDRAYVVLSDGSGEPAGEVWLRRPVAVAETAAARALAERTDLEPARRAVAAHGLAVFLDNCPVCETPLSEGKAGGCCGPPRTDAEGHPLRALVCRDCRTQFAAFE